MMRRDKYLEDGVLLLIFFSVLWTFSGVISPVYGAKKVTLHIAAIFPMNGTGGWQGGQACKPAADMALVDVNKRPDLLPGYHLEMHWNDSQCEPGLGAAAMYDLLYRDPDKLMLLAGCSTVCTTVAEAAKMWNLIVLCYGASSPALANRNRFQTLFRTHPNAIVHNPTRIYLMNKFKWKRIAILQQAEEVFITTGEDLEERCKLDNIEIVTRQSFLTDPREAVRNLGRQDARIIIGLFYVDAARRVLCEIYQRELYGKKYVWLFIGWYDDNWYEVVGESENVNCTKEEMRKAAEGHLTTEALMWNGDNQKTISGMTAEEFRCKLHEKLEIQGFNIEKKIYPQGYQEAPLAYDAIWAVALAFNRTIHTLGEKNIKLENFHYNSTLIKDEIYSAMDATEFLGVSGQVAFSAQGDRIALTQIEQMQNGKYEILGHYDVENKKILWKLDAKWIGGKPPQDRTYQKEELRGVSLMLFVAMSTIASIGILWVAILIVFNYIYRDRKVIQLSHPVTNTLMLIGFSLCFASIYFIGMDGQFVPASAFSTMCTFRKWVLSVGFTLAYGAMFSKVWRVHRLTTKHKSEAKHKIQPWKLYLLVASLVGIEIIFLSIWTLIDPMERVIETFETEYPDPKLTQEDFRILPYLEHCQSSYNNIWLGITYSFKGLLLIFGLFLAYETRSIKVRHINDSRLVAMSIYNVAVLCLITTPVTMVIASQQDASFAFVTLAIIFSSMIAMGLIFIPKIIEVIREGNEKSDRSSAPDAGTTKEEEERYQKLLTENDQLKNILEQKEERLKLLRIKLEEKNALRRLEGGSCGVGGGIGGIGGGCGIVVSGDDEQIQRGQIDASMRLTAKGMTMTPTTTTTTNGLNDKSRELSQGNICIGGSGVVVGIGGNIGRRKSSSTIPSPGIKNNNIEHIEVLDTYYVEGNSDSAYGQGVSMQTTTTDFELSESYL